jgi:hypothetical protein
MVGWREYGLTRDYSPGDDEGHGHCLLLIVTAALELATGIVLLVAPSLAAEVLLGVGLGSPAGVAVGRVAGATLLSIGVSCWLGRGRWAAG